MQNPSAMMNERNRQNVNDQSTIFDGRVQGGFVNALEFIF